MNPNFQLGISSHPEQLPQHHSTDTRAEAANKIQPKWLCFVQITPFSFELGVN